MNNIFFNDEDFIEVARRCAAVVNKHQLISDAELNEIAFELVSDFAEALGLVVNVGFEMIKDAEND